MLSTVSYVFKLSMSSRLTLQILHIDVVCFLSPIQIVRLCLSVIVLFKPPSIILLSIHSLVFSLSLANFLSFSYLAGCWNFPCYLPSTVSLSVQLGIATLSPAGLLVGAKSIVHQHKMLKMKMKELEKEVEIFRGQNEVMVSLNRIDK